jgi:hypothetical protein
MAQNDQLNLVTVAGAAAGGIGLIGFVTFAGGVVLWRRFSEMGLPGDEAVSLMPKSALIATGADFLAPAFAFTALTVIGLIIVRVLTTAPEGRSVAIRWAVISGLSLLVAEIIIALLAEGEVGSPAVVVLVLMAAGSAFVVGIGFYFISSLAAVALIAFLCSGTFWVARAYDKTSPAPKVLPMAYSRAQPGEPASVESGYFVAETSDRVWFASLPQSSVNELREFPRTETDDIEVGQLSSPAQARQRDALFVANLCGRLQALASAAAKTTKPKATRTSAAKTPPVGC